MTNPVWSYYGGDPVPVNLDAVRGILKALSDTAEAATTIDRTLAGIASQATDGIWIGESADAFRSKLEELPDLVRKVERSYRDAATAVTLFLSSVEPAAADALALVRPAWSAVDQQGLAAHADTSTPEGQARVEVAFRAVQEMTAKVDGVREDYQRAETRLVAALGSAQDQGIPPDSFWHKLVRTVEDWSGTIGLVLAVIVVIALVVLVVVFTAGMGLGLLAALALALETLGPLLTALTALQIVHFAAAADRTIQYDDHDEASWGSLTFEAATIFVPMGAGKAAKTLGTSTKLTRHGAVASHVDDLSTASHSADDFGLAASGSRSSFMARGEEFARYAKKAKPEPGYHDVIVHGNGKDFGRTETAWQDGTNFNHRVLARLLQNDPAYSGRPIRLLSCHAGAQGATGAQNLANKLGVEVLAPSDKLWAFRWTGRLTIGEESLDDTGSWILFRPGGP